MPEIQSWFLTAGGAWQPGHDHRPAAGGRAGLDRGQPGRAAGARGHLLPAAAGRAARPRPRRPGRLSDWRGDTDELLDGRRHRARQGPGRAGRPGRARAGPAVALAPEPGPLRRGAEPPPGRAWSTRPAARSCSTSGSGGRAATTRSRGPDPPPRPARTRTSPSSAGSTCATGAGTTSATSATRRRCRSTTATATARPGTTCSSRSVARRSATCRVTFRERWEDPTPLDHRNPWRARLTRRVGQARHPEPAAPDAAATPPRPAPTPSRSCAPTRPAAAATRSPRTASAASPAPTSRRCGGPGASSTSRTSTCGRPTSPRCCADALRRAPDLHLDRGRPPLPGPGRAHEPARPAASASRHALDDGAATPAATGSRCSTSRTTTAPRSTCTPRCA